MLESESCLRAVIFLHLERSIMDPRDKLIVALDISDVYKASKLVNDLFDYVGGFKVGFEFMTSSFAQLMTANPSQAITRLANLQHLFASMQGKIFWDGKWNDIPNTVGSAASGLAPLKVKYMNVHASTGMESIAQAVANKGESQLLAVTVLTSIGPEECLSIFGDYPPTKVASFAHKMVQLGVNGVICSPQELTYLGETPGLEKILKVTPGVRPIWAATDDQKRVTTPSEAIEAGATALVVGRPITNPSSEVGTPVDAAKRILEEIASV